MNAPLPTSWPWPWWAGTGAAVYVPAVDEAEQLGDEGRSAESLLDTLPGDHWLSAAEPNA